MIDFIIAVLIAIGIIISAVTIVIAIVATSVFVIGIIKSFITKKP